MATSSAPAPDTTETVSSTLSALSDRVAAAVKEVLESVSDIPPRARTYVASQVERANKVVDDLTAATAKLREDAPPLTELPVVVFIDVTSRARAVVSELVARVHTFDEEHKVSESTAAHLHDARSRASEVFSEAAHRLQALKAKVLSATGAAPAEGAEPGDVKGTVASLLAALEDVVHQVAQHKRVVDAQAKVTELSGAARERLSAASDRAAKVADDLRSTLGKISTLPSLTVAELEAIAADASTAAKRTLGADAGVEGEESKTATGDQKWASSVARSVVTVTSHAREVLSNIAEAVRESDERFVGAAAGEEEPEAGAAAGEGATAAKAAEESAGGLLTAVAARARSVVDSAHTRFTGLATTATDVTMSTVVSVDKRLGVAEKATAVAAAVDSRLSVTAKYASALEALQGLDTRLAGGMGAAAVAKAAELSAPGVEFVKSRYGAAAEASAPDAEAAEAPAAE